MFVTDVRIQTTNHWTLRQDLCSAFWIVRTWAPTTISIHEFLNSLNIATQPVIKLIRNRVFWIRWKVHQSWIKIYSENQSVAPSKYRHKTGTWEAARECFRLDYALVYQVSFLKTNKITAKFNSMGITSSIRDENDLLDLSDYMVVERQTDCLILR